MEPEEDLEMLVKLFQWAASELSVPGTGTVFRMYNTDALKVSMKDPISYYSWTECNKLRMIIHIISRHKRFGKK